MQPLTHASHPASIVPHASHLASIVPHGSHPASIDEGWPRPIAYIAPVTQRDAIALIDHPGLRTSTPAHWADLGCGAGTFTLALSTLLPPGSTIDAIDLRPSIAPQTTPNGVTIQPRAADFTTLAFAYPNRRNPDPTPISGRLWPGTAPLSYHGILMANSLHYVRDQHRFLSHLKISTLLLVEYDTDMPVTRWVPYPLSFISAIRLLQSTNWQNVKRLGTHPSAFGRSELYALLAER